VKYEQVCADLEEEFGLTVDARLDQFCVTNGKDSSPNLVFHVFQTVGRELDGFLQGLQASRRL
jgi:hypothetical protein